MFMVAMKEKWLPDKPINEKTLAMALVLENQYWKRQTVAVENGIKSALSS